LTRPCLVFRTVSRRDNDDSHCSVGVLSDEAGLRRSSDAFRRRSSIDSRREAGDIKVIAVMSSEAEARTLANNSSSPEYPEDLWEVRTTWAAMVGELVFLRTWDLPVKLGTLPSPLPLVSTIGMLV